MSLFLSSLFLLTVTLVSYILLIGGPHARRRLEEERQRIEEEQKRKRKEVDGDKVDQAIEFDLLTTTVPIDDANVKTDSFFTQTGLAEVLTIRTPTVTGSIVDDDETRPLFIVIPGNPGLVKFYRVFIANLDRLCQGKVEFRCVSFVGHTSASINEGRSFTFQYQLEFFRRYLKQCIKLHPKRKIFLSGHSVGAYVCLQLLASLTPSESEQVVSQVFLLFPTVSEIGTTPNGRTHTPILKYGRPVIVAFMTIVNLLPKTMKEYILFHHIGLHPYEVEAAHGVLHPHTVRNCLFMAMHEMAEIGALQTELVKKHIGKLYWIWGHHDQWAPLYLLQRLKTIFGSELRYEMAEPSIAHAFVVGGAQPVADMVYKQLKQFI